MRIAVGADHAGFPLNERVIEELSILTMRAKLGKLSSKAEQRSEF